MPTTPRLALLALTSCTLLALSGCTHGAAVAPTDTTTGTRPPLAARPTARATADFWHTWGDGKAELSGYRATVMRYGAPREAEIVLVYVTESLDRASLIKEDVSAGHGLPVLKLNYSEKFQTGIYPYSLLTSVFTPVDGYLATRFSPVKVTLSAQEWCGHVYHGIWPGDHAYESQVISYFESEGEHTESVETPSGTLYEDALFIQLRELDGQFANGGDWSGSLVPRLWSNRRVHQPLRPTSAHITRAHQSGGIDRFTVSYADVVRTFDVEQSGQKRIVAWAANDGEHAEILNTARLPYWSLNGPGGESYREQLGLPVSPSQGPAVPAAPTPAPAPAGIPPVGPSALPPNVHISS